MKIAFLAYTYSTNGLSLQAGSSTVIPYISESLITQQMELAKAQAERDAAWARIEGVRAALGG